MEIELSIIYDKTISVYLALKYTPSNHILSHCHVMINFEYIYSHSNCNKYTRHKI